MAKPKTEKRPWLALRPGETEVQRQNRLAHTCPFCGLYLVLLAALDAHEDECPHQGSRGDLA